MGNLGEALDARRDAAETFGAALSLIANLTMQPRGDSAPDMIRAATDYVLTVRETARRALAAYPGIVATAGAVPS